MRSLKVLAALIVSALYCTVALADEPQPAMPMMPQMGSDPLAPLAGMIGSWEGDGTSTFGPFHCEWTAERQGAWIVSLSHIFANGEEVETVTQLFGVDRDGGLISYSFDSSGEAFYTGTMDENGNGSFHSQDGEATRDATWTVNADGTVTSTYKSHDPNPTPGMPADFEVNEVDHHVN